MANSALLSMLLFVIFIDAAFFLGEISMNNIGLGNSTHIGADNAGIFEQYNKGGYVLNDTSPENYLSPQVNQVQSTGNVITDTFSSVLSWIGTTTNAGWNFFINVISGPVPYINSIGFLPIEFKFIVGGIWYALTIFLFVAFTIGRTWV